MNRRQLVAGAAATLLAGRSSAQAGYPTKPVTILLPYPAGGPGDLMARSVGEILSERLGQPFIVDPRPGAAGQIAGAALVRAPADGYTLMLGDTSSLGINIALYSKFGWNPPADVRGVASIFVMPIVLLVPAGSPFQSVAELVAFAKSKGVNYASQGAGSAGHLLGEMLRDATGGKFNHIPYKGSAPAMNDLLGGQVDMLFDGVGPALQYLRAGKLRCLAIAGPQPLAALPGVPSMSQLGYRGVELSIWFGFVARSATPDAIVQTLSKEISNAMAQPKIRRRFEDLGFQFLDMSSEPFTKYIRSEADRWGEFVRARKIIAD